eukprot:TRINITY_DN24223_c0_g1_i1.p2 TRINITY_DN24223_c0_g1~~TRINITY_DN24223_c0_g1_i1.p2  ORF type:complete len:345 (+),score=121.96 TRINITY_DN24223_c0_g1_i1:58-1035(+)
MSRGGWVYRHIMTQPVVGLVGIPMTLAAGTYGLFVMSQLGTASLASSHLGAFHDQFPSLVYDADRFSVGQLVRIARHDVLGRVLTAGGEWKEVLPPPDGQRTVLVDEGQLADLVDASPRAPKQDTVRQWAEPEAAALPVRVRASLLSPCDARRFVYQDGRPVIHLASPDLGSADVFEARRKLVSAYTNVLKEFAVHLEPEIELWKPSQHFDNKRQPWATLRIAPITGSSMSATVRDNLPDLTWFAVFAALDELDRPYRRALMKRTENIDVCVASEADYGRYETALLARWRRMEDWRSANSGYRQEPDRDVAEPVQLPQQSAARVA